METLNVVIREILLCLALAWALGFLAAWILFKRVQNQYEQEIEELEENLSYASSCNKNQEREITAQNLKLKELENAPEESMQTSDEQHTTSKKENNQEKIEAKKNGEDQEMLKLIDDILYSPKK